LQQQSAIDHPIPYHWLNSQPGSLGPRIYEGFIRRSVAGAKFGNLNAQRPGSVANLFMQGMIAIESIMAARVGSERTPPV
jgi:hypothetical protein